jgi:membrane protein implicated in regulation of membrane protease activity
MSKHAWITAIISLVISFALFGIGAVTILMLPVLSTEAQLVLPVIVLLSLLVAPFAAERLSPRLTPGERHEHEEDVSSGRTYPRGG